MIRILQNALKLPSGRYLVSTSEHEILEEEGYAIGGGTHHLHLDMDSGKGKCVNMSLTTEASIEDIKMRLLWEVDPPKEEKILNELVPAGRPKYEKLANLTEESLKLTLNRATSPLYRLVILLLLADIEHTKILPRKNEV